jgi:hypothetical protein
MGLYALTVGGEGSGRCLLSITGRQPMVVWSDVKAQPTNTVSVLLRNLNLRC